MFRWLISVICLCVFPASLPHADEPLPVHFEVLKHAKSGDVLSLQTLFEEIAETREETGDNSEHDSAFSAFQSTHTKLEETVQDWLAAYPESAHPHAARAAALVHEALIVRGQQTVRETPKASMRRMRELLDDALPYAERALQLDPTHSFAAWKLFEIGIWTSRRGLAERARRIDLKYRDPATVFWNNLFLSLPQWGGGVFGTRKFCTRGALIVEGVTKDECELITAVISVPMKIDPLEALQRLQSDYPGRWNDHVARLLLDTYQFEAASELILRAYPPDPDMLGRLYFGHFQENPQPILNAIERRLSNTPRHPILLGLKAEILFGLGDEEGATKAIEKALVLGSTIPIVRSREIRLKSFMNFSSDRIKAIIDEALEATEMNITVYEAAHNYVQIGIPIWFPTPQFKTRPKMKPLPNDACWRLEILGHEEAVCSQHPSSYICYPAIMENSEKVRERFRSEASCN